MHRRPWLVLFLLLPLLAPLAVLPRLQAAPAAAIPQQTVDFSNRIAFLPVVTQLSALPDPPQPPPPPQQYNLEVSLRASPDDEVAPGADLSYEIRLRNSGNLASPLYGIALAYDVRLDLINTQFEGGDGIVELDDFDAVTGKIVLAVNPIPPGATRRERLIFRVDDDDIEDGDRLGARVTFACSNNPSVECRSNTITIDVVDDDDDGDHGGEFRLAVSPDRGPPGTRHVFSGDRFRPGERVVTWLNTPSGVEDLDLADTADDDGNVRFELTSRDFAVGDYSLVAYGEESETTGVGPFRVQGPDGQQSPRDLPGNSPADAIAGSAAVPRQAGIPPIGGGGIAGKLLDPDGAALAGVPVKVFDASGRLAQATLSLPSGTFFVASGLASGVYTVEIAPRLSINPAARDLLGLTIPDVGVTAPGLTRIPTTTLQRGGVISGTVRGDGVGLADVLVLVASDTATRTLLAATVSAGDGSYTTPALPAGSYTLTFRPGRAFRSLTQIYSGTALSGISVTPPNATTGVDVNLPRRADSGQISGRVSGDGGVGLADALVRVTTLGGQLAALERTAADGSYTTRPLAPGVYALDVRTRFSRVPTTTQYSGGPTTPPTVTLAAGQVISDVNAQLTSGGGIAGRLLGAPTAGLTQPLALARVPVLALDAASGRAAGLAETDATGVYTITGLASGNYKVWFASIIARNPLAWAYSSAYFGGADRASARVVTVVAPTITTGISATLQPHTDQ